MLEENEPLRYRLLRQEFLEKGFGSQPLKTENDWRRLIANYWGLVTQVDLSVGAILDSLENLGLADDTIVVYTSDHGDMMGSHRLLAKTVMYEESSKVPWLMRIPQLQNRQISVNNSVSHIDLVPTLLDLMNFGQDSDLPGKSLIPLMRGEKQEEDHVFIEWNPAPNFKIKPEYLKIFDKDLIMRIANSHIRTAVSPEGWKLCLCDGDKSQLFNLKKDPYETTNLFYTGQYQKIISRLTAKIHTWQQSVSDNITI